MDELFTLLRFVFGSIGWLAQGLLDGRLRWTVALAFVAVPTAAGCAYGWTLPGAHLSHLFVAFFFGAAGFLLGSWVLRLFALFAPLGVDPIHLGELAMAESKYGEARRWYERARNSAQRQGNQGRVALALRKLGKQAHLQGNDVLSRSLYQRSLEIAGQVGDREGAAMCLHQLAVFAHCQGEAIEARRLYTESLDIFVQLGSAYAETVRGNLAKLEEGLWSGAVEL